VDQGKPLVLGIRRALQEAHVAAAVAAMRPSPATRVGNTLAVAPWSDSGSVCGGGFWTGVDWSYRGKAGSGGGGGGGGGGWGGGSGDLMLAHTGGEGASQVHLTRMSSNAAATTTSDAASTPKPPPPAQPRSWRMPTRCATQPVMQVELAVTSGGWFGAGGGGGAGVNANSCGSWEYVAPTLLGVRDAAGVSLIRVGGGLLPHRKLHGQAVQVGSINTRLESAYGFRA